jgi:hypothetical protein
MVFMRYRLNGQHYERWVELSDARRVKDEIEKQGGVIYWSERK